MILNTSLVNLKSSTNHHIAKNKNILRKFQRGKLRFNSETVSKQVNTFLDMFFLTIFSSFCLHSYIDFSRSRHFEQHHT